MNCAAELPLIQTLSVKSPKQDEKSFPFPKEPTTIRDKDDAKSLAIDLLSWISKFKKQSKCSLLDQTKVSLTELAQYYVRIMSTSVTESYTNSLQESKLRETIREYLPLCLYVYRGLFLVNPISDCEKNLYLNNMSDLLAKYIDLELKASKENTETHCTISARLISCLCICLEHSTKHLLDTLIKIQLMHHNYHSILDPIIKKIIKCKPVHPESNVMYIRYLLVYYLWRKINIDLKVKDNIISYALSSLGQPPLDFPTCVFEDVLPEVPKNQPNSIQFLLQQEFDIKKSCELFIQTCKNIEQETQCLETNANFHIKNSSSNSESQNLMEASSSNSDTFSILVDNINQSQSSSLVKSDLKPLVNSKDNNIKLKNPPIKSKKSCSRKDVKKQKEIVIIDLTTDVILEKVSKKQQETRKINWLEKLRKKPGYQTPLQEKKKKQMKKEERSGKAIFPLEDSKSNQVSNIEDPLKINNKFSHQRKNCTTSTITSDLDNRNEEQVLLSKSVRMAINTKVSSTSSHATVHNNDNKLSKVALESPGIIDVSYDSVSESNMLKTEVVNNIINDGTRIDRVTENTNIYRYFSKTECNETSLHKTKDDVTIMHNQNEAKTKLNGMNSDTETEMKNSTINLMNNSNKETLFLPKKCNKRNNSIQIMSNLNGSFERFDNSKEVALESNKPMIVSTKNVEKICENNLLSNIKLNGSRQQSQLLDNGLSVSVLNGDLSDTPAAEVEITNYTVNSVNTKEGKDCVSSTGDLKNINLKSDKFKLDNVKAQYNHCKINNTAKKCTKVMSKASDNLVEPLSDAIEPTKLTDDPKENKERINTSINSDLYIKESKKHTVEKTNQTQRHISDPFDVNDTELQDRVDGLALLAIISERLMTKKVEKESKCEQIKVKDYASMKDTPVSHSFNEDIDTNASSLKISQESCENPTPETINRIVGIYPEDGLDKVALNVEVSSTSDTNHPTTNFENEPSSTVSYMTENSGEQNTYMVPNDLIPVESSMQTVKENTNVILNGETVVLLQKSPNSQLYIINKAVETGKESDIIIGLKSKNWLPSSEECSNFEVVNTIDNSLFNFDVPHDDKEMCQDNKYVLGRNKGIKVEPKETNTINLLDTKVCSEKNPMSADSTNPSINKVEEKPNESVISTFNYGQNIKQECNHSAPNCGIEGYASVRAHPHDIVVSQLPLHIPVTHPSTISSIYANCPGTRELYVPYHKHCTPVSCSLKLNATASLHQHSQSGSVCGRSHCSCLNCTYDYVTHCRQCILPATETHMPCIESSSYYFPTHSPVQTSAVEKDDRAEDETVISKLCDDDDNLVCKIDQKQFKRDLDNRLPFKKRLKVHAMMSVIQDKMAIKETLDSYPGMPMMSIAGSEALDGSERSQVAKSVYELSCNKSDDLHSNHHYNSDLVKRDYCKETFKPNGHHKNEEDNSKKTDHQFRAINDQKRNATVYQESCHQRTFKTPAQRKQVAMSCVTSLKRLTSSSTEQENTYKKVKSTQPSSRQIRSSKRKIPKVNYSLDVCYPGVDAEWNPSDQSKRKRKKTSR